MDSSYEASATSVSLHSKVNIHRSSTQARLDLDLTIIETSLAAQPDGIGVDVGFEDLYKSLTVAGRKMIDKINELLSDKLPGGVQSLRPEQVTPEATADRIVQGTTAFFDIFAKQHADLGAEELLQKFMQTIRSGIDEGYDDAYQILEGLGAFEFDGVKDGIQETKRLIEEKLAAYEAEKRRQLGLEGAEPELQAQAAQRASDQILQQAGRATLSIQA